MKRYWLIKSEPSEFSIDDLSEKNIAHWDGVRNYQARNFMMNDMKKKDLALFYHSNCKPPGIVGIAEVASEAYPDHTSFDKKNKHFDPKSSKEKPIWYMVDFKFKKKFKKMITLDELKQNPKLKDMLILRKGNRLSITPVTEKDWLEIVENA